MKWLRGAVGVIGAPWLCQLLVLMLLALLMVRVMEEARLSLSWPGSGDEEL